MNVGVKSQSKAISFLGLYAALRMSYFLTSIAILGLSMAYGLCIPLYVLAKCLPTGHFKTAVNRLANTIMQRGIWLLMRLQPWLQGPIEVKTPDDTRGVLLVSNHRSILDVFILLSEVRGIKVLAKSTLFKVPFLNLVMWASSQISVPRGNLNAFLAAIDDVKARLAQGERIHIFPELSRCPQGFRGMKSFSAAPFVAAHRAQAWVLPIAIVNTDDVWPKGGFALHSKQVQVQSLQALDSRDFASPEALKIAAHQQITNFLAQAQA